MSRLNRSFELTFTIKIHSSLYQDVWPETAGVLHVIIEFCITTCYIDILIVYVTAHWTTKRRGFIHSLEFYKYILYFTSDIKSCQNFVSVITTFHSRTSKYFCFSNDSYPSNNNVFDFTIVDCVTKATNLWSDQSQYMKQLCLFLKQQQYLSP